MKENLCQEHVKTGLLLSPAIPGIVSPAILGKIWLSHLHKNYIFEVSDDRAIR